MRQLVLKLLLVAGLAFAQAPSAFARDAASVSATRAGFDSAKLAAVDFAGATAAFDSTLATSDFAPEQFSAARGLLASLADAAQGRLDVADWKRNLPETSAWWFLIDGFLSRDHPIGIAHIRPAANST